MTVVSRREWGAPAAIGAVMRQRPVSLIVVHHTASKALPSTATADEEITCMRQWHRQHQLQGWQGIGYNFVGFNSGRVYEGRGYGRVGAHAPGANGRSLGYAFALDARRDMPTIHAVAAYNELRRHAIQRGDLTPDHEVHPHSRYADTLCPGALLLQIMPVLSADVFDTAESPRLLMRGMRGEDVRRLQVALVRDGHMSASEMATGPGIFGPATDRAVRLAQRVHGIAVDGWVGRDTRRALGL